MALVWGDDMPLSYSNSRQSSCTRLRPLMEDLLTELQRCGKSIQTREGEEVRGNIPARLEKDLFYLQQGVTTSSPRRPGRWWPSWRSWRARRGCGTSATECRQTWADLEGRYSLSWFCRSGKKVRRLVMSCVGHQLSWARYIEKAIRELRISTKWTVRGRLCPGLVQPPTSCCSPIELKPL